MSRALLFVAVAAVLWGCVAGIPLTTNDAEVVLAHQLIEAPNPGRPGPQQVRMMYYGSGEDSRRPEYRDSVSIVTQSVDASKLVSLGNRAKERNKYWGFSPKAFPINARVWYPEGEGPFPLALIVHGNHNPRDFSDPGYQYLGELLASRGFILASIDMNFINGRVRQENDARGWLLLQHLAAWREFSQDPENPFFGRVDLDRIALMGHSRGGEAVAVAAAFNSLAYYPDDASVEFDFNFGIQSVIAIAPVDGQYSPTGRPTPLTDVNYLVFHGSHDGDVSSFHGLRQYGRVTFTGESERFKAAVYVYRANHGQWNSIWNNKDSGPRSGRTLDLGALIDPEEQRDFGKLYISAFLETTLNGRKEYLPMFRDHRVVGGWLPKTMYINRFQASGFRAVADFEEDIDLTTGSERGVTLQGDSLAKWSEKRLLLRSRNRATTSGSQSNQAAELGWNNRIGTTDSVGVPGVYRVSLPDGLTRDWGVDGTWTLDFLLAATEAVPGPRSSPSDSTEADETADADPEEDAEEEDEDDPGPPIDLTLEVEDALGVISRVPVSRYGPVRRPLKISVLRRKDREKDWFGADHEIMLQSFSVLMADLQQEAPQLDPAAIRAIRFVFDRAEAGTIILDEIGFSKLDPAFTALPLPGSPVTAPEP